MGFTPQVCAGHNFYSRDTERRLSAFLFPSAVSKWKLEGNFNLENVLVIDLQFYLLMKRVVLCFHTAGHRAVPVCFHISQSVIIECVEIIIFLFWYVLYFSNLVSCCRPHAINLPVTQRICATDRVAAQRNSLNAIVGKEP